MCGIAGRVGPGDGDPAAERRMLDRMRHRGPDDQGQVRLDGAWLGHTRLSIVDVEGGHQPLGGAGDGRWLVGNGEIYNHDELRPGLTRWPWASGSDNEVALALLTQRGPDALGELEGMYALLSAGADGLGFVAARDPVGIKPLYWTPDADQVRFASEMAAFDQDAQPLVEAFPPGHVWTPEDGLRRFAEAVPTTRRLGCHDTGASASAPTADDLGAIRDTLVAAVERQMMGDVPVGVLLSGGLDSTLVAAIAARRYGRLGERLQTFAVGAEGSSDLLAARRAAAVLDTEHREHYTAAQARGAVAQVVRSIEHFDPSLVRSAVPNWLVAELAAQHVKVVLTGEGADELFAGYAYYHDGFDNPEELHAELVSTVERLHGLNLQRCDRVTMAHSLEARVPFLDRQVIALALGLPAAWKAAGPGLPEKALLRRAFAGWLPDDLLWRGKEQFGDGSGATSALSDTDAEELSEAELATAADDDDTPLRNAEELAYYRIWRSHLPGIRAERTLTRFATV